MKALVWLLAFVLLLALEAPILRASEHAFLLPDVVVLAAIYLGSRAGWASGLLTAAAVGLFKDGFALAAPVGVFTEIAALGFLATRLVARRVDLGSAMPTMATCGVGTFVATLLFLLFEVIFHRAFDAWEEVLKAAPSIALGTMLVVVPVFGGLDRLAGLLQRGERMRGVSGRLR